MPDPKKTEAQIAADKAKQQQDDAAAAAAEQERQKAASEAAEAEEAQRASEAARFKAEQAKSKVAPQVPQQAKPTNLYRRKSDNLPYALKVEEDVYPYLGRTHVANNTKFHWRGTKEQFVAQFVPLEGAGANDPQVSTGPIPVV